MAHCIPEAEELPAIVWIGRDKESRPDQGQWHRQDPARRGNGRRVAYWLQTTGHVVAHAEVTVPASARPAASQPAASPLAEHLAERTARSESLMYSGSIQEAP